MLRNTSPVDLKSRLDQDYESDEEAMQAEAEAQAQQQATGAPRKAKKVTSEVLAAQLLRALTESQSTSQQIIQDKLKITTLVQGLSKTETNAPKLKKFTKEDIIRFVDLYDVFVQANGRDSMVELIVPTSVGYAAVLCKMSKEQIKGLSNEDFIEFMYKKFSVDNATGHKKVLQSFAMTKCTIQGFYDRMWRLTLMTSRQNLPVILHLWTPQRRVHRQSRLTHGLSMDSSLMNFA